MDRVAEPEHGEGRFALVVALAFLAVTVPVALHHEMWSDEVQAWMLARDTPSLAALLHALRYEGHPAVWYLVLRPFTWLSGDPRMVQVVCLAVGTALAYVIARFAPFPRPWRLLLVFSYFIAYGYTIVARGYGLETLFLFGAVALLTAPRPHRVIAALAMALAANVSVYGAMIVAGLVVGLLADAVVTGSDAADRRRRIRAAAAPVVAGSMGILLALAQVWPASDAPYHGNGIAISELRLAAPGSPVHRGLNAWRLAPVWRAYVPVPQVGQASDLWESDALASRSPRDSALAAALSALLVIGMALAMRRSVVALVTFLFATGATFLFSILIYVGALYHDGHFFVVLVMGLWLAAAASRSPPATGPTRSPFLRAVDRFAPAAFTILLVAQVVGTIFRFVGDYVYPYSEAEAAAAYLRTHGLTELPIAAYPSFQGTSLSAYLGRPVYSLQRGIRGTYTPLDRYPRVLSDSQIVAAARACCGAAPNGGVLVVTHPLHPGDAVGHVHEVARFPNSIVLRERFYLYRIVPAR